MASERELKEIGGRLRLLRIAYGFDSFVAWGRFSGVSNTAWHNYEAGTRRISIDEALKVCAKTGASMDWIYRGDDFWHTLPGHVQQKISAARDRNSNGVRTA